MRANEWIPIPEVGDTLDNLLGHCRKQREKKGLQIDGKKRLFETVKEREPILWKKQRNYWRTADSLVSPVVESP